LWQIFKTDILKLSQFFFLKKLGFSTDDLIKDVDGIKSDTDEDPLPPTPPRPSTPTVPQQRLLPWKPKVRYIHMYLHLK
jgi:hypothetical protein